jgi:hypothetical protein
VFLAEFDHVTAWLCWWRPPCLLRRVLVNLTHDPTEAFEGVLWAARGPWLTFKDCAALKAGQPPVPMLGDVVIERAKVAYLQVLS